MKYLAKANKYEALGVLHAQQVREGKAGKDKPLYPDGTRATDSGIAEIPDEVATNLPQRDKDQLMDADGFAEHVTSEGLIDALPPLPDEGQQCVKDRVYNYNGQALACYQTHIRTHHDPLTVPALFGTAKGKADPWVQPTGAHDAYKLGAVVTHKGKTWENTGSDANVWEPGVFGWTEI